MIKVLVIAGVTGVGKSEFGVKLAKLFNGEIISGDSVALYKELTVGSAKISQDKMDGIIHHGIDILTLKETFSVRDYQIYGRQKINDIVARGKLPIIVGGTGLYIRALLYDYVFSDEEEVDMRWADFWSNENLHAELSKVDPQQALLIHANNRKRVLRALSIARLNQKSKSELLSEQSHTMLFDAMILACTMPRDQLYERLNIRVEKMVEQGLLEEVKDAVEVAGWDHPALTAIGYKEFKEYFEGTMNLSLAIALVQRNTRRFAKRQITWFKHQLPCRWVDMNNEDEVDRAIEEVHEWMSH
jgi:tRNA dimethylallyltransferase